MKYVKVVILGWSVAHAGTVYSAHYWQKALLSPARGKVSAVMAVSAVGTASVINVSESYKKRTKKIESEIKRLEGRNPDPGKGEKIDRYLFTGSAVLLGALATVGTARIMYGRLPSTKLKYAGKSLEDICSDGLLLNYSTRRKLVRYVQTRRFLHEEDPCAAATDTLRDLADELTEVDVIIDRAEDGFKSANNQVGLTKCATMRQAVDNCRDLIFERVGVLESEKNGLFNQNTESEGSILLPLEVELAKK